MRTLVASCLLPLVIACSPIAPSRDQDPDLPPGGPISGVLSVNGGARFTNARSVAVRAELGPFARQVALHEEVVPAGSARPELGEVHIDDAEFSADPTTLVSFELSAGDGSKYLFYQFRDLADHRSALQAIEVVLDTSAPSDCNWVDVFPQLVATYSAETGFTASRQVWLSFANVDFGVDPPQYIDLFCSDADDLRVEVTENGVAPERLLPYDLFVDYLLSDGDGTKSLAVRLLDPAGNALDIPPIDVILDTTPPLPPRMDTAAQILNYGAMRADLERLRPTCSSDADCGSTWYGPGDGDFYPGLCDVNPVYALADYHCVPSCSSDDDCAGQPVLDTCDTSVGVCARGCASQADCGDVGFWCDTFVGYCLATSQFVMRFTPPGDADANFGCYELKGIDGSQGGVTPYDEFVCSPLFETEDSFTVALRPNGGSTVRVRSRDLAGNVSSDDFVILNEDSVAPNSPVDVVANAENGAALVEWANPPVGAEDVAGYLLYYDTVSGQLSGSFSANGPSPIDVGKVDRYRLSGLQNDTDVFIVLQAYDAAQTPYASLGGSRRPNFSGKTAEVVAHPNLTNPSLDLAFSYSIQAVLYDADFGNLFASAGDVTVFGASDTQSGFSSPPVGIGFGGQMDVAGDQLYLAGGALGVVRLPRDFDGVFDPFFYGAWSPTDTFPVAATDVRHVAVLTDPTGVQTLALLGGANGVQIVDYSGEPVLSERFFGGRPVTAMASLHSTPEAPLAAMVSGGGRIDLMALPAPGGRSFVLHYDCVDGAGAACSFVDTALSPEWWAILSDDPDAGLWLAGVAGLRAGNGGYYYYDEAALTIPGLAAGSLRCVAVDAGDLYLAGTATTSPRVGVLARYALTDTGGGVPSLTFQEAVQLSEVPASLAVAEAVVIANLGHYGIQLVDRTDLTTLSTAERYAVGVGGPANSQQVALEDGLILTAEGTGGIAVTDFYEYGTPGVDYDWQVLSPLYDPATPILELDSVASPNQVNRFALAGDLLFVAEDDGLQVFSTAPLLDHDGATRLGAQLARLESGLRVEDVAVANGLLVALTLDTGLDTRALTVYDLANLFAAGTLGPGDRVAGFPVDTTALGEVAPSLSLVGGLAYFLSRVAPLGYLDTVDLTTGEITSCSYNNPGFPSDLEVSGNQAFIVDRLGLIQFDVREHSLDVRHDPGAASPGLDCPQQLNYVPLTGRGTSVRLAGSLAYVTTNRSLEIIDTGDADRLTRVGILRPPAGAMDAALAGAQLTLAGGPSGVLILNLATRGKMAPARNATLQGGIGRKLALAGPFALVIDDERDSGLNSLLYIADLTGSALTPLNDFGDLPGSFVLGSGAGNRYLDLDVDNQTLRLVVQTPSDARIDTYGIDRGFALQALGASGSLPLAPDAKVVPAFAGRWGYLLDLEAGDAWVYGFDLGDPRDPRFVGAVSLSDGVTDGTSLTEVSDSLALHQDHLYVSVFREGAGLAYSELVSVDLGALLATGSAAAGDVEHVYTRLKYDQLAVEPDRGLLIASEPLNQVLALFSLDAQYSDDYAVDRSHRAPLPHCRIATQFAGVLTAHGHHLVSSLTGRDATGVEHGLGTQLYELDADELPALVASGGAPGPGAPEYVGEGTTCPTSVVAISSFVDLGGNDVALEGPFVYLVNERGLDVVDLR